MRFLKQNIISLAAAAFLVALAAPPAKAVPALQLYIEGAVYDPIGETWTLVGSGGGSISSFRLWAIGNVGHVGTIENVRMSAAFFPVAGDPDFDDPLNPVPVILTPTQVDGDGAFSYTVGADSFTVNDPSTPSDPNPGTVMSDGAIPTLSDLSLLPTHGVFKLEGIRWIEFALGDFTLTDSEIGDFITDLPTEFPKTGQINAYDVSIDPAYNIAALHFDLYDNIQSKNKAIFAPFSHDAAGSFSDEPVPPNHGIPEPSMIGIFALALAGMGLIRRRRAAPRSP